MGVALAEIRDSRLYRADYSTFEDYCREKWGWERRHAYRLITAAAVTAMSPIGLRPQTESQARELAKVEPEKRVEVLELAIAAGPVTARSIREARESFDLPPIGTPAGDYLAAVERQIERDNEIHNRHDKAAAEFNDRHAAAIMVEALLIKITLTIKEAKRSGRWRDFDDPVRNIPNQIAKLQTLCKR